MCRSTPNTLHLAFRDAELSGRPKQAEISIFQNLDCMKRKKRSGSWRSWNGASSSDKSDFTDRNALGPPQERETSTLTHRGHLVSPPVCFCLSSSHGENFQPLPELLDDWGGKRSYPQERTTSFLSAEACHGSRRPVCFSLDTKAARLKRLYDWMQPNPAPIFSLSGGFWCLLNGNKKTQYARNLGATHLETSS